jgi:hypothetical protein
MDRIDDPRYANSLSRFTKRDCVNVLMARRTAESARFLIKGYATVRNYPREHFRPFGDIDLAVSKEDYPKLSN